MATVGAINCELHTDLCERHGATELPTVRLYYLAEDIEEEFQLPDDPQADRRQAAAQELLETSCALAHANLTRGSTRA